MGYKGDSQLDCGYFFVGGDGEWVHVPPPGYEAGEDGRLHPVTPEPLPALAPWFSVEEREALVEMIQETKGELEDEYTRALQKAFADADRERHWRRKAEQRQFLGAMVLLMVALGVVFYAGYLLGQVAR